MAFSKTQRTRPTPDRYTKSKTPLVLLVALCLLLSACLPEGKSKFDTDDSKIVEGFLGEHKFSIPQSYFSPTSDYFAQNNVSLQIMYPDFSPLEKRPDEYWREGKWWKNISIILQYYPNSTLTNESAVQKKIDFLKATKAVGEEYGLVHLTQPEGEIADNKDIWIEKTGSTVNSFITCSEKIIEKGFPQCTQHYHFRPKLSVRVHYDKRLFENWKTIDVNVRDLLESFRED